MRFRSNRRILIFGRPGSGKTTLSVKLMKETLRRGEYIYSNIAIKWFGDLYIINSLHKIINFIIKLFLKPIVPFLNIKLKTLSSAILKFDEIMQSNEFIDDIPTVDLQLYYVRKYLAFQTEKKIQRILDIYYNGIFKSHWFVPERYVFLENLEEACIEIIRHATVNQDDYHGLYWDEGFVDLDYSNGVSNNTTNFFNQSRKLNVDVIISTQRPVAVYPSFRALCDYMIRVRKIPVFNIFLGHQYFVDDDPNALPDIVGRFDGSQKPKLKYIWRGKYVFPYFATRQSIGLTKLITKALK